ncbi:unnamed protein product, partial [Rotaria sp. Silwood2]
INDYLNDTYFQKLLSSSGLIIDYHSAGIIPDHNHIHEKKIEQIIQFENFQVCLHEAREAFDESIVHELINETENDL